MKPIISENIRIRYPNHFSIGEGSIVDDFCYFSTKVKIGNGTHIAAGVNVSGGKDRNFIVGDYCGIGSGTSIICSTNDFVKSLITIFPPEHKDEHIISGDVIFENFTGIGLNSVVMPDNRIPEGTAIGALSFVPSKFKFKKWAIYAGIPIRFIRFRDKKSIIKQYNRITKRP